MHKIQAAVIYDILRVRNLGPMADPSADFAAHHVRTGPMKRES